MYKLEFQCFCTPIKYLFKYMQYIQYLIERYMYGRTEEKVRRRSRTIAGHPREMQWLEAKGM